MVIPSDQYANDVDFTALALQYHDFARKLKPNGQLDFSDPETVRQLTKSLLQRDFQLHIELPDNRLCPPVPNRFNYVVFAQKLIDTTRLDYEEGYDADSRTLSLDIGTGASAIYPLLACRQRQNWYCLATEIDSQSREYAQRNVKANNLESRIRVVEADPDGRVILPTRAFEDFDSYTIRIMMTNPPFYASEKEMLKSAKEKSRPPNSACTGAPVEMITEGGEIQFISRIIDESKLSRNRRKIQWFSSMLGKLSSVPIIVTKLKSLNCTNYVVTDFIQGQKTRRWCIAWSWLGLRPPVSLARSTSSLEKNLLPFPSEYDLSIPRTNLNLTNLHVLLTNEISKLDLLWRPTQNPPGGMAMSKTGDVWSRKARRRPKQSTTDHEMKDATDDDHHNHNHHHHSKEASSDFNEMEDEHESEPKLVVRITIHQPTLNTSSTPKSLPPPSSSSLLLLSTPSTPSTSETTTFNIRWIQGHDSVLFESFCGWLKRKMDRVALGVETAADGKA